MRINTKLSTWSLTTSMCAILFMSHLTAADSTSKVDCSGVAKWNSDGRYKSGDLVVAKAGVTEYDAEYKCTKDSCHGAGDNQPYYDNGATWQKMGVCT
jgi:hypothetical protein